LGSAKWTEGGKGFGMVCPWVGGGRGGERGEGGREEGGRPGGESETDQ